MLNSLHYGWLQCLKQCLFLSLAHSAWVQFEVFVCVYLTTCTCNIVLYMNISVNKEKWREQRNKKSLLSELYEVITIWSYLLLQSKKGKFFRFSIFQRVHIEFSHQMLSLVATRKGKHNEYLLAHTYTLWSNRKNKPSIVVGCIFTCYMMLPWNSHDRSVVGYFIDRVPPPEENEMNHPPTRCNKCINIHTYIDPHLFLCFEFLYVKVLFRIESPWK